LAALCEAFCFKKYRALAKLVDPALRVEKSEADGGVICWRRKKYVWQQQATDLSLAAPAANVWRNNAFRPGSWDYFGERMLA
jgi:hypothetical protein